ncbi:MAG: EamA family transporter, partial [Eubacterium sp.]
IFKGIKLTKVKVIACAIAVVGVALVLQVFNLGTSNLDLMGVVWALANALILASAYFLIAHVYYPNDVSWQAQLFYPNLFGALFLYVTACPPWEMIGSIAGAAAENGAIVWIIVLGFAALPQILSFSWIQLSFGMIDAPYVSMAYCLDPVIALIVGFFAFGESMTLVQMAGIVLTILCIFYTYYAESKEPVPEVE